MIVNVNPFGSMEMLSQLEVNSVRKTSRSELYQLFRNCSLAVLKSGSLTDDSRQLLAAHKDFDIKVIQRERGVKLELINPPQDAFVDGSIIRTIQANLFSVLRDIIFVNSLLAHDGFLHEANGKNGYITNLVFMILRNAKSLPLIEQPDLIVCWGGHSINRKEYKYAHAVGFELGLRELNICTGCGPGAMEAPMRGAAAGHAQQRYHKSRFIGVTEPSIIAAEPPNALVNELIIMPDIEKRLEAFVRIAHGVIIFPGGAGTAEELLFLLGILMDPRNAGLMLPVVLTGPKASENYFAVLDKFIVNTLGKKARKYYQIIIDDAVKVASIMKKTMPEVRKQRIKRGDAYSFNWTMKIAKDFQQKFIPSHENMANLDLHTDQPVERLASNLRRAFSGIVAGNVKPNSMLEIQKHGSFQLNGEQELMLQMDKLLTDFIKQGRMKLPGTEYTPCYQIKHK